MIRAPARAISMLRSKTGTAISEPSSAMIRRRVAISPPVSKVCGAPLRGRSPRASSSMSSKWNPSIGSTSEIAGARAAIFS